MNEVTDSFDPPVGVTQVMEPGLRRILAPNPSPMTHRGTNTYLLGESDLAVIDPGPASPSHLEAILAAVQPGQRISHIVVTHAHLDHSPLAARLSTRTGAPVYGFGPATAGRSAVMTQLALAGLAGGGEGVDTAFEPDVALADREVISGEGWTLRAIHTPGHIGNHLCLAWNDVCFTADHIMGWSSSLVSPPDGDLTDFMASCRTLQSFDWRVFHPGHGAPINDPAGRLGWIINHRQARETAILTALAQGPADATTLATQIYTDTATAMMSAATRNVFAHLVDLTEKSMVSPIGELSATAKFRRLMTSEVPN